MPFLVVAQEKTDSLKFWKVGGNTSLNFSQVSLTNWAAGGVSSASGVALFKIFGNYNKNKVNWENSLDLGFGLLKEQDKDAIKSEDKIELNSKYGIKQSEKWNISTLFNFKTQFADGYKHPNTTNKISAFMAPAYTSLSVGFDYKPNKAISLLLSPLSGKMTIVNDDELSAIGAYGLEPGDRIRYEIGSFLKLEVKTEIMKNVTLNSKIDLFSNYLNHPENIDINWDLAINMKINDFLSANLTTNLIYDDDIKIPTDDNNDGTIDSNGPKVQFKEMFGLGINLKF
jgi:hypothetical protein